MESSRKNRSSFQSKATNKSRPSNALKSFLFFSSMILLVGSFSACGGGSSGGGGSTAGGASTGTSSISGTVMGGLTGIANAAMELCEAQSSGPPLTIGTGTSDSNGKFTIHYNPPSTPGLLLYVVAKPGSSNNQNLNLMNVVGVSGAASLSTNLVVNELTTVAVAYEAISNGLTLTGLSLSGSSTQVANFNKNFSNLVNPILGTISSTAPNTVPTTDLYELANGLENCVNNTSSCSGSNSPNLSNIETATTNLVNQTNNGPTVATVGSSSGTYSASNNNSTNSSSPIGTLLTANVDSSGNYSLETFPFTATGNIPTSSPATSLSIASGQVPVGGGFDSSYNVYAVATTNSTNTSETITLYNYSPTSGFGSALNSVTLNATSGNTCNSGGGINTIYHSVFASCTGSSNPQFCIYFYNASGLQPCVEPSFPSSLNTQNLRGDNALNLLWVRNRTQNSTSTTYSYSGVFKISYSSSSLSLGTETTFGPVSLTVPSTNATSFGFDNNIGLIFFSAYCNSSGCPSSEPLDILSFNTSTGVINSSVISQTIGSGNLLNSPLSYNAGSSSDLDQTDQIFFLESYSSGINFTPYSYTSSGAVTQLTGLTLSSLSSPNGNTNAMIDPNSHIIFVPEGSSSTANGIEAILYNKSGTISNSNISNPISPKSGLLVPSCSNSCNNIPNFLFDAVN